MKAASTESGDIGQWSKLNLTFSIEKTICIQPKWVHKIYLYKSLNLYTISTVNKFSIAVMKLELELVSLSRSEQPGSVTLLSFTELFLQLLSSSFR